MLKHTLQVFMAASVLALAGCQQSPSPPTDLTPVQAVLAAAAQPEGITGTFRMTVRNVGRQDGRLYLDSEPDYRDQRCLAIDIAKPLVKPLEDRIGGAPEGLLIGKEIRVSGTARRVTVWFFSHGIRTDKYYYQTHVIVTDLAQLQLDLAAGAKPVLPALHADFELGPMQVLERSDQPPTLRFFPTPGLPNSLARDGIPGSATVKLHVAANGYPETVTILEATRPDCGAAAAAMASRMIFHPAMTAGAAVPIDLTLTVRFLFK